MSDNEIKFNKINKKSDCDKVGHSLVKMVTFDNGRCVWGEMVCQKCGKIYSWQYDYVVDNCTIPHEPVII